MTAILRIWLNLDQLNQNEDVGVGGDSNGSKSESENGIDGGGGSRCRRRLVIKIIRQSILHVLYRISISDIIFLLFDVLLFDTRNLRLFAVVKCAYSWPHMIEVENQRLLSVCLLSVTVIEMVSLVSQC